MKAALPILLGAAMGLCGCAAQRVETPRAVPKSAAAAPQAAPPQAAAQPQAPRPPAAKPAEAAAPGEVSAPVSSVSAAVPPPAAPAPAKAPLGTAPSATESAYVFAPQQAAVATHPVPVPAPSPAVPGSQASSHDANPSPAVAGELQLSVIASSAEIATGAIMTVDVMASSTRAVVDAPLHLTFDPAVFEYVDGTVGGFLAQGGSSVVFFADGRTHPGDVAVAAGRVERAQGASGAGLLCRLRFRGTASGTTPVLVGRAQAWGVDGNELVVSSAGTTAVVR